MNHVRAAGRLLMLRFLPTLLLTEHRNSARGTSTQIQLESPDGNCPFLIEFDGSAKQLHSKTVDDVVSKVGLLLKLNL